jgi:hypothetical protein
MKSAITAQRCVICGYRTPWSNEFLRTRSAHTGVAEHSLHMQAEAIDIRLPGIPTSELRDAALRLQRGGVGLCLAITKNGPFLPRKPTHKTGQAVLSMKSTRIL